MDDRSLPPETSVERVALRVADLDRVATFYRSVVGLEPVATDPDRVVLGASGDPLLVLSDHPEASAPGDDEAGLFHTAIRVPDRAALGDALARIDAAWQLTGASDHRASEALYLRDPEDNGVEIYCDRPRDEWPTADGRVQIDTLPLALEDLRERATGAGSVPDGTDVGHVHLEVTSLSEARAFYVDALGLTVRQEWDGALFVAAGDYHHHVGLNTWNERTAPAAGRGLDWFELAVPVVALAATRRRFADCDVAVTDTEDGFAVRNADGVGVRVVAQ